MKTYEVRVTQNLSGYYEGFLKIEANNEEEATKLIKSMTNDEINDTIDWYQGDEYYEGDINSIKIEFNTLTELE